MKHLKVSEQIAQQERRNNQLLTAIKEMIKTPSLRQEGFDKLLEIDADLLVVKNRIYYYYIKGKYYVLEFKDSNNKQIELLEFGNDCYTDMVAIAYENNFSIQETKFHFSRAYCKYLIGKHNSSKDIRRKLFRKVEQISERVLSYKSHNSSFLWLTSVIKE